MEETGDLLEAPPLRELAAVDARFRAIVGVSFDACYDWDVWTCANYFSEHLDEMLGQPSGSARRWFCAWVELEHGDDKERVHSASECTSWGGSTSSAETGSPRRSFAKGRGHEV